MSETAASRSEAAMRGGSRCGRPQVVGTPQAGPWEYMQCVCIA